MNRSTPSNAKLLAQVRRRFANVDRDPFSGKRIYFENAGGTLRLKAILPLISTLTALPDNAGRDNAASKKVDQALTSGREAVRAFLGAKSGHVIAEQSTTSMMFRLIRTVAQSVKGKNIVTTNLDHASVYDATRMNAKQFGLEARIVPLDPRSGVVTAEAVAARVDRNTVALTVIHSSNVVGTKNPVKEIVKAARAIKRDIFIILDGAQHASHGLIDVEAYGADAYVFVPYKTFAKTGISFAHLNDRFARLPHENLQGKLPLAWDLGTREIAGYACMSEVVSYLHWLAAMDGKRPRNDREGVIAGMRVIERLELELMKAFLYGTAQAPGLLKLDGVTVHGQVDNLADREAIFSFSVRGWPATAKLVDHFLRHGIVLHNRVSDAYSGHTLAGLGIKECIRVSACHYNTVDEVTRFLRVLADAIKLHA